MRFGVILLIILSTILVSVIVGGTITKKKTSKRLKDIDGFAGVYTKGECVGNPVVKIGEDSDDKKHKKHKKYQHTL